MDEQTVGQAQEPQEQPLQDASAQTDAQESERAEEQAEKKPERTYTQKDLDNITEKVRRNAYMRAQQELQDGRQSLDTQQPAAEPQREDFKDYESYLEARAVFRAKAEIQKEIQERDRTRTVSLYQSRADEMVAAGNEQFPDFDAKINEAVQAGLITPRSDLHFALLESDSGAVLAYHLATHPKEARALSAMSPLKRAMEIGRLEERLTAKQSAAAPSSAPAPIKPVSGSGGPTQKDEAKMSDAEWFRMRQKAAARKR